MKAPAWLGTASIILIWAAGLTAQSGTSGQSPSQNPGDNRNTITITGCLQSPGSEATPSANTASNFVLTNAVVIGGAAADARGGATTNRPAGTSGSTASGDTASSGGDIYLVDGNPSDMRQRVNQQVRVMGRLELPASPGAPVATVGQSDRRVTPMASLPRVRVESMTMVAAACTTQP